MRRLRWILVAIWVAGLVVLVTGCNVWPFSLFFKPRPYGYGIAWALAGMNGKLPSRAFAQYTLFTLPARAQTTGLQYTERAAGVFVPETAPFESGTKVGFYAWQQTASGRTAASAQWTISPAGLCKQSTGSGPTFVCEPRRVGAGTVTAVIGSATVELPFQIYPGFMLDNGRENPSGLDPWVGADRGQIGFDFGLGYYAFFRDTADLYIAENGDLIAPGGVVATSAANLEEVGVPNMASAGTRIGRGAYFPPDIPLMKVYVLKTRNGRHVAVQVLGTYATCLVPVGEFNCPSPPREAPGYRAYALGYRMLD